MSKSLASTPFGDTTGRPAAGRQRVPEDPLPRTSVLDEGTGPTPVVPPFPTGAPPVGKGTLRHKTPREQFTSITESTKPCSGRLGPRTKPCRSRTFHDPLRRKRRLGTGPGSVEGRDARGPVHPSFTWDSRLSRSLPDCIWTVSHPASRTARVGSGTDKGPKSRG